MKTKFILLLFIILIVVGFSYYYVNYLTEDENVLPEENKSSMLEEETECDTGYKCETIDGESYKWTNKTLIKINEAYNYDKDELEAGTLKIEDGTLEFVGLDDKILMKYDYLGKVKYIEESIDSCDDTEIYLVLTESGNIYISDRNVGIMAEEPFFELENENKYSEFMVKVNKTDYLCTVNEIYGKSDNNKVIKMLSNENVTLK